MCNIDTAGPLPPIMLRFQSFRLLFSPLACHLNPGTYAFLLSPRFCLDSFKKRAKWFFHLKSKLKGRREGGRTVVGWLLTSEILNTSWNGKLGGKLVEGNDNFLELDSVIIK